MTVPWHYREGKKTDDDRRRRSSNTNDENDDNSLPTWIILFAYPLCSNLLFSCHHSASPSSVLHCCVHLLLDQHVPFYGRSGTSAHDAPYCDRNFRPGYRVRQGCAFGRRYAALVREHGKVTKRTAFAHHSRHPDRDRCEWRVFRLSKDL